MDKIKIFRAKKGLAYLHNARTYSSLRKARKKAEMPKLPLPKRLLTRQLSPFANENHSQGASKGPKGPKRPPPP